MMQTIYEKHDAEDETGTDRCHVCGRRREGIYESETGDDFTCWSCHRSHSTAISLRSVGAEQESQEARQ